MSIAERGRERTLNRTGRWRVRGACLLAGAALVVIFPEPSLWWAAWFVLVPWLVLIRRAPNAREAAARGWFGAVGFLVAVHYWLIPSTSFFIVVIAAVLAALWMPWAALTWLVLTGELTARHLLTALTVPGCGWVLVEAARSWSALGGPWALLGTSQWRVPVLLASASVGGVWLPSLLIVASNVAVTVLLEARVWRTRAVAAVAGALVLAAGPACFAFEPRGHPMPSLRVAVVEAGVIHNANQRLAAEIAATEQLPPGRYQLIVWGESSVGFDLTENPAVLRRLESLASHQRTDLLVDVDAAAPGGAIGKSAVLIDSGGIIGSYQKMRLVPFGEYIPTRPLLGWVARFTKAAAVDRVRGDHVVVMHSGTATLAPLICFEAAFPDMSRTAARRGAGLLVFQTATTTFQGSWAPDQLAALAAVRAAESGRPTLQASLAGTSAAFDDQGREIMWHPAATGIGLADLPSAARATPFDRFGDWVLVLSVATVAIVAIGAVSRRQPVVFRTR